MITRENGIPKYIQLKNALVGKINSEYHPGDKFLTEQEIMRTYKVSSATVAHAMKELTAEGYFSRKRGGGSFVIPRGQDLPTAFPAEVTELFLNEHGVNADRSTDPLNWFIKSEISRGIINNFNGKIRILNENELIDGIRNGWVKNIILNDPSPRLLDTVQERRCRYVLIDQNHNYREMPNRVSWEQMTGVYNLMSWLIQSLGHRRVGLIYGAGRSHYDRLAGYQISLRVHELPFDDKLAIAVSRADHCIPDAIGQLLALSDPPTAIFVDTDLKAIAVIAELNRRGLRVPEDISIAGFDDIPGAGEIAPPLTTIKAPYYDMGCAGVKMLMRMLETGAETVPSEILQTKLVIRNSCSVSARQNN